MSDSHTATRPRYFTLHSAKLQRHWLVRGGASIREAIAAVEQKVGHMTIGWGLGIPAREPRPDEEFIDLA